jgi:CsoR family transcriptional regulator, copper-sensing transcriptional repressor
MLHGIEPLTPPLYPVRYHLLLADQRPGQMNPLDNNRAKVYHAARRGNMKQPVPAKDNSMVRHHTKTSSVVNRLSRIEGHVAAIKRMVKEDKPCPDVLIQLAAVRSAIQKTAQVVLEDHIGSCLSQMAANGVSDAEWRSLKEALDKYLG